MTGDDLKYLRSYLKISQRRLAAMIGVSYVTVCRWEKGVFKISPLARNKIKSMLKQDIENVKKSDLYS